MAYDIALAKPRRKVAAILEKYGHRVNKSVFECMVTPAEAYRVKREIASLVDNRTDSVAFYLICLDCFSKIEYYPSYNHQASTIKVVA